MFSIQPFSQALLFNYNDCFVKCGSTRKTDSIKIGSWSSCLLHLNDFQIKRSQFTSKKDVWFVFPTTRSTNSCWDLEVKLSSFWLVLLQKERKRILLAHSRSGCIFPASTETIRNKNEDNIFKPTYLILRFRAPER